VVLAVIQPTPTNDEALLSRIDAANVMILPLYTAVCSNASARKGYPG